MSRIQIFRNGEDTPFTKPIKRALLRDSRLSYGARGLFAMLWDFPSDWVFYSSHVVGMSPCGMTQLKGYLKELRSIGAIKILPKQLSNEEAVSLNKVSQKTYRAGQITGKQWILNNPDYWAIETSLSSANNSDHQSPPKDRFSTCRQNQASDIPNIGESTTKGLQLEGSANIRPLLQENEVAKISSGADFIYPKQITAKERDNAKPQLDSIDPILAQAVLDELAARLNANKVTGAPLSYLRSLITRAKAGQFMPEAGIRIASAREQAKLEQIKKSADVIKPSNPNEIPKHLAAMRQVLGRKSTSNSNQEN
jgi:hypothetical protein